jgi:hypothetical protein
MEQDDFAIDVLNCDMESLGASMNLFIPSKVRDDREVNTKKGSSDRLHLSCQSRYVQIKPLWEEENLLKFRESMDKLVHQFTSIRKVDELAYFWWIKIKISVPRLGAVRKEREQSRETHELFAFGLPNNIPWDVLELPQRRHTTPHSPINHLTHI